MDTVIVSGGALGYGIIRCLGEKGIHSQIIYKDRSEPGIYSKYCTNKINISAYDNKSILEAIAKLPNECLLIPANDEALEVLSKNKKQLSKKHKVPIADYRIIKLLIDKHESNKIADAAGVPRAREYSYNSNDLGSVQYPCILKPLKRHEFYKIFEEKLYVINNKKDLIKKLALCKKHKLDIQVIELIPGPDTNLYKTFFYVTKSGKLANIITEQKIRQYPPNFGVGRVMRTVENQDIIELTKKFLKKIPDYIGPGSIEFKLDLRDGKYKFIEMNSRNHLQVYLAAKANVNIPYMMYQDYSGQKIIRSKPKQSVHWIHIFYDLYSVFMLKDLPKNLDFFKPYFSNKTFAIENIKDPKPMINTWKFYVLDLMRYILK